MCLNASCMVYFSSLSRAHIKWGTDEVSSRRAEKPKVRDSLSSSQHLHLEHCLGGGNLVGTCGDERWRRTRRASENNITMHANQHQGQARPEQKQTDKREWCVKYVLEILNQTNYNLKSWHTQRFTHFVSSSWLGHLVFARGGQCLRFEILVLIILLDG